MPATLLLQGSKGCLGGGLFGGGLHRGGGVPRRVTRSSGHGARDNNPPLRAKGRCCFGSDIPTHNGRATGADAEKSQDQM